VRALTLETGNAKAAAVRPALERRWGDALASFDARAEIGVLGLPGRAGTVEELGDLMRNSDLESPRWYGYGCLSTGSNSVEPR
jgi:hypothetical protein